jgi:hypothetical protein
MARPDARVLGHHLRRLDGDAFAAFVADLWTARGYETRRDGGRVRAARGGTALTIAAGPVGRDAADADVDAVVTPRVDPRLGGTDARVVDAADLRDALWYALDRETARALCARHLGAPPADLRPPLRRRARERLRAVESPVSPATVAVLLVVLVAAGALGTSRPAAVDPAPLAASDGGTAVDADGTATDATTGAGTATAEPTGPPPGTVPGLGPDGVTDPLALVAAHERALGNRSYTIWIDSYQPREGVVDTTRVQRDVDVAVAGERYLLVETEVVDGTRTRVRSVYHDGTDSFLADGPAHNVTFRRYRDTSAVPGSIDPTTFAGSVVQRSVTTISTDVTARVRVGTRTLYRVEGGGRPSLNTLGRVANYTVVLLVAESGLVVDGRVSYTALTSRGTFDVRFEWTYDRLGRTQVEPPTWYEARFGGDGTARNATDARTGNATGRLARGDRAP